MERNEPATVDDEKPVEASPLDIFDQADQQTIKQTPIRVPIPSFNQKIMPPPAPQQAQKSVDPSKPLKMRRKERFCQRVFSGEIPTAAFREIYAATSHPKLASSGASRLSKSPDVIARLAWLESNKPAPLMGPAFERMTKESKIKLLDERIRDSDTTSSDVAKLMAMHNELTGDTRPDVDDARPAPDRWRSTQAEAVAMLQSNLKEHGELVAVIVTAGQVQECKAGSAIELLKEIGALLNVTITVQTKAEINATV